MRGEAELRTGLAFADEEEVPATLELGLAEGALVRARRQTRQRRAGLAGSLAVLAVAATVVGVVRPWSQRVDEGSGNGGPGPGALARYEVNCGRLLSDARSYTWDTASRRYIRAEQDGYFKVTPSPDGTRALLSWDGRYRVVPWSQVASTTSQGAYQPPGDYALAWTPDGRFLVDMNPRSSNRGDAVNFYDPATWARHQVPIPKEVLDLGTGWQLPYWVGNMDDLKFIMVSDRGDRIRVIDRNGATVREFAIPSASLKLASGYPPPMSFSPSGRYLLATVSDSGTSVFDTASGSAVQIYHPAAYGVAGTFTEIFGWTSDDRLDAMRIHHGVSTQAELLSPSGTVLRSVEVSVPDDKDHKCTVVDGEFAPASQFPGAIAP